MHSVSTFARAPRLFALQSGFVNFINVFRSLYSVMSTQSLLTLLTQIKSGIVIYEPFRRTPEEIGEFQDTVYRLEELKRLGLIRSLFTEKRVNAGGEYCALAMVQGGLTAEGERLLLESNIQQEAAQN